MAELRHSLIETLHGEVQAKNQGNLVRTELEHVARHAAPAPWPMDLEGLERFVYGAEGVGGREMFEEHCGRKRPLTVLIRSLMGLDRGAAKEGFAHFRAGADTAVSRSAWSR